MCEVGALASRFQGRVNRVDASTLVRADSYQGLYQPVEKQKLAQVWRGLIFSNPITLALVLHYKRILNQPSQPMNHLTFLESIKNLRPRYIIYLEKLLSLFLNVLLLYYSVRVAED